MGTPGEGSPLPLFLFSIPLEGKETASSEQWPVESVDGAPQFQETVKSAQNFSFPHGKVDLITAGDSDMAVITPQLCFYNRKE